MKQQYIHTTIDATGAALSLGSYWDCSGRYPVESTFEFIGNEGALTDSLCALRDDSDAEFMHVVNRSM